jgi:DNA-binding MarR family transcriptional regulator
VPKLATRKDADLSGLLLDAIPPVLRAIREAMRDLRDSRLTVPQFRVLGFVSLQSCTNKQLADWQGVSLPAMSRMVDCLVKRDLLMRTADTVDRRQVKLELTKRGREEFERLRAHVRATLAGRLVALRKADKSTVANGLNVLKEIFSGR